MVASNRSLVDWRTICGCDSKLLCHTGRSRNWGLILSETLGKVVLYGVGANWIYEFEKQAYRGIFSAVQPLGWKTNSQFCLNEVKLCIRNLGTNISVSSWNWECSCHRKYRKSIIFWKSWDFLKCWKTLKMKLFFAMANGQAVFNSIGGFENVNLM